MALIIFKYQCLNASDFPACHVSRLCGGPCPTFLIVTVPLSLKVLVPKRLQLTGLLFQIKNQRWTLTGTGIGPLNARWTLGSDFVHDAWHSFRLLLLFSRCILEIWGRMPLAGSWRRLSTSLEESGMSGLPSALQVS